MVLRGGIARVLELGGISIYGIIKLESGLGVQVNITVHSAN